MFFSAIFLENEYDIAGIRILLPTKIRKDVEVEKVREANNITLVK